MAARLLLCAVSLAVFRAPPTDTSAAEAAVRSVLAGPAIAAAVDILGGLPLLSSADAEHHPARSVRAVAALDAQPSRGLMDDANRLVTAVADEIEPFMLASMARRFPMAWSPQAEAPSLMAAVRHVASFSGRAAELASERAFARSILIAAREAVAPATAAIRRIAPPSVLEAVADLDVGLLAAIAISAGSPDVDLAVCAAVGFPTVGFCPDSGCPAFRPVDRPVGMADIRQASNAAWNRRCAGRVEAEFASSALEDNAALWAATIGECLAGTCHGPYTTLEEVNHVFGGADAWRCMERFGVKQLRADGTFKLRGCDNAARSGHNDMTSLGETITCETADWPARVALAFELALGSEADPWSLLMGTDDVSMAYRRLGNRTPQYGVVCQANPETGEACFFILPGMNFGLKAAVNQFNRVAETLVEFARVRLGVCCTHFFDDVAVCEPCFAKRTGQVLVGQLHDIVGFPFAPAKHEPMRQRAVFLGVLADFSQLASTGVVSIAPKPGRMKRIVATLTEALAAGRINPSAAKSLAGKLQFLLASVLYGGRVGRGFLWHFRIAGARGHSVSFTGAFAAAASFLLAVLAALPPRRIHVRDILRAWRRPPVVVWSDAMWELDRPNPGGVGFVIWVPENHLGPGRPAHFLFGARDVTWGDVATLRLRPDRRQQVGQLEALAAVCPYESAPAVFRGADVLHFIDNTSALYGVVKGSSPQVDSQRIISALHIAQIVGRFATWFSYVPSKSNISDLPSRGAIGEMRDILRRLDPTFSLEAAAVAVRFPDVAEGWEARGAERVRAARRV